MTFAVLSLPTALLVVSTLLPLWWHEAWWVRGWDFPRLQLSVLAFALLLANLALLDLRTPAGIALVLAALACLVYQAWWIAPYTRLHAFEVLAAPPATGDADRLRVMTANVLMGNRNCEALLAMVAEHRPDVLVTLESDAWWQSQLDRLGPDYPHALRCPLDNLYGMHLYSRLPLSDAVVQFLVDVPSMHACVSLRSGRRVRVHFLHPAPPSPTENPGSGERDAELLVVGRSVADADLPVVVAGDLNDVAWSATTRLFRRITGLLDPRVGRGMFNTFHAGWWCVRWPLDHLFHSGHFRLIRISRLPAFGSDHFPVLVELHCAPQPHPAQDGLDPAGEDHRIAGEKIAAQDVHESDVHVPER